MLCIKFAEYIPKGKFTAAEIQGFILKHKKNPDSTVREAKAWVQESFHNIERDLKI